MKNILIITMLFVSCFMNAQKIKVIQGGFGFLKAQKEVNVEFDYSIMTLMKEEKSEEQYIKDRSKDLSEKKKNNGTVWENKWNSSKELIWNPKFLELVNVVLSKKDKDVNFQEGLVDAKYTLIVQTVWIYPGWDAAVMKQPAKVSTNLIFVETANKSNVLLKITSTNAPGDQWGNNFSNESRIGEGYAKTGKSLAKLLLKKAY
jgi:hypothetical protein